MTDPRNDLVREFIRVVAVECPKVTTAELLMLEAALRRDWGGKRCYVGKSRASGQAQARPVGTSAR